MFTVMIEVGICGFGYARGTIGELRCGVVRFGWCRGSLLSRVSAWRSALSRASGQLAR